MSTIIHHRHSSTQTPSSSLIISQYNNVDIDIDDDDNIKNLDECQDHQHEQHDQSSLPMLTNEEENHYHQQQPQMKTNQKYILCPLIEKEKDCTIDTIDLLDHSKTLDSFHNHNHHLSKNYFVQIDNNHNNLEEEMNKKNKKIDPLIMNINGQHYENCLINTQLQPPPPPYTSLVPDNDDDDDIEGQTPEEYDDDDDGEDSALNSSTSVFDFEKSNIEPININNIEIIRTRSKQSKIRISFMILFKSCFCRGPMMMRILSALFFAISSFLLVVINKIILTTYHFPSVMIVGLGQVFATIIILNVCRRIGFIKFPYYSREINIKISPLPIFFFGNLVAGLGSTKRLNLPMLTVLRRFTILMTMIGEYYILGITQSTTIKMTVFMMIGGAIIAASNDLAFDMMGYICVLLNDIFSTFNGIYMKKKLDSRDLGKYGILYYNALFISIPLFVLSLCIDDYGECFLEFEHWNSPWFVLAFLMSNIMGFVLMYSTALCTQYNSALTTTIVGCLKNILVTFIGMYIGGDYIFSIVNFIGLNISMIGSLIYSYVIFVHKSTRSIQSSASTSSTSSDSSTPDLISKAKQSIVKE